MLDTLLFRIEGIFWAVIRNALFAVVYALLTIGLAISLSACIVGVWSGAAITEVFVWMGVFSACFLGRGLVECLTDWCARRFANTQTQRLHEVFMEGIYTLGPRSVGDAASSLALESVVGIEHISQYLISILPKLTDVIMIPIIIGVAIYTQDVISGLIVTVCYPFIMLFMKLIGHTASDDASKRHEGFKRMSDHFVDSLRGIWTLKAFGWAQTYAKKVFIASERYRAMTMRTLKIAQLSSAVLDIFATCGLAAVAIMLGFRLVDGEISFFPALVVLILVPEFFKPIKKFAADYHASLEGKASLHVVYELIDRAQRQDNQEHTSELATDKTRVDHACATWGDVAGGSSGQTECESSDLLSFNQVSFAYEGQAPVLNTISFSIKARTWTAIVGASGAGKTTLAALIAGFCAPSCGEIQVGEVIVPSLTYTTWRDRVAYLPQDPFIFHASLRDNVRFYVKDASDERIVEALEKVGLTDLVVSLPDGLDTYIGDGGRQFSGGQLQRLALARVLLDERRDIWVLDEPTAHLDIETEYELKRQIVPLMIEKTVFVVTHRLHWIDVSNTVITLNKGMISRIDTHDASDVMRARCALCEEQVLEACEVEESVSRVVHMHGEYVSKEPACRDRKTAADIEWWHDRISSRQARLEWLGDLLSKHKKLLIISLVLGLIANLFAAGLMFTSGFMISLAAAIPATVLALHLPSLFVRIFGIGKPCISYAERLLSHDWILRVTSTLRAEFFTCIDYMTDRFTGRSFSIGKMLSFFTQTIERAQDVLIRGVLPLVTMGLTLLVIVVIAAVFSIQLAGVIAALLASVVIVMPLVACVHERRRLACVDDLKDALLVDTHDALSGLRDWVLSGRLTDFVNVSRSDWLRRIEIEDSLAMYARVRLVIYNAVFCAAVMTMFVWATMNFGSSGNPGAHQAVAVLAGVEMQDGIAYPPHWIAAFVLGLIPFAEIFFRASDAALEVARDIASVKTISAIEEILRCSYDAQLLLQTSGKQQAAFLKSDVGDAASDAVVRVVESGVDEAGKMTGDIDARGTLSAAVEFVDVSFSYQDGGVSGFRGSLSFEAGSRIAILGRSGAGKSTVAQLIAGSLVPDQGHVRMFGRDKTELQEQLWRYAILIEQDPHLFNQSIKENLLLGKRDASDDEIEAVLADVQLDALLGARQGGLSSVLDGMTSGVSGGEKTRIALARALLAQSLLVVLDEPFAGLDPDTEKHIMEVLFEAFKGKTLVVITHHLYDIDRFDRVLFIDEGAIVLDGDPVDLARSSTRFKELLSFERGVACEVECKVGHKADKDMTDTADKDIE